MPHPARLQRHAAALGAGLDRVGDAAAWLVLPLGLLLFVQWPLRDLVGAWSRQANDAGQWLFALYVALALRMATRARAHLAAGLFASRLGTSWQAGLARCGEPLAVLPFALFVVVVGAAPAWRSLHGLEAFPDTGNPLYFIVRCSAWLLALLMAMQAIVTLVAGPLPDPDAAA